ncbi:IclR family transcriptional regulator [Pantoea tagorei]
MQVLTRAVAVLRVLNDSSLSLGQIAALTGLPRSTVQRLVDSLAKENLVETHSDGVRLGWGIHQIAKRGNNDIVSQIRPALEELFNLTHETVDVSTIQGQEVSFLDRIISDKEVRVVPIHGKPRPLYAMANGKSILSSHSDETIIKILPQKFSRLTNKTVKNINELMGEIRLIRKTGFSYDLQEHNEGVCAIGKVLKTDNYKVYAMSVVMPAHRYEQMKSVAEKSLEKCCAIAEGLLRNS